MDTIEDDLVVMKNNINVSIIRIALEEEDIDKAQRDIKMLELSVDNSRFHLEKVEDRVDGCVSSSQSQTRLCMTNTQLMGLEIQQVQKEWREGHEGLLRKFSTTRDVINRKFVRFDEELERVVELMGQKMETLSSAHTEAMAAEEVKRTALEARVEMLEERLRDTVVLLQSFSNHLNEVEGAMVEDPDTKGEAAASSSSLDFGPTENMVAIPVPGPLVIHTLTPISDVFIPPSVCSSPSPPYVQAWEEDPVYSGVPECWAGPDA